MDWQEIAALSITVITVGAFAWSKFRPRKFSFARDTHCGCGSVAQSAPRGSIVFHARKGERSRIVMRMR